MKFEFSEQEVNTLKALIDLAIKAGGLQVAEAGVVLAKKLSAPIEELQKPQVEEGKVVIATEKKKGT